MATNRLPVRDRLQPVEFIYGYDKPIAQWICNQLNVNDLGNCRAIGLAQHGEIIAGIYYRNFSHPNIEMGIASTSPHWANRRVLRALFHYPFNELDCKRVTVFVDADDEKTQRFDERLGFVYEGTLRECHPRGDAKVYGMLKRECKWIK